MAKSLNMAESSLAWRNFLDEAGDDTDARIARARNALPQSCIKHISSLHAMRILCEKTSEIQKQGDVIVHPVRASLDISMKKPVSIVPCHIVGGIADVYEFCIHISKP